MKLTKRGEYALRALLALAMAYEQGTLSLRQISEQETLPVKFLEQIMMVLKRNGFVRSLKGKQGGYTLARAPQTITVGEVIRAVDGPLAPMGTGAEIERRIQRGERHCGLLSLLLDVRNSIADLLDRKTLADVCEKSLELARSGSAGQMYYI